VRPVWFVVAALALVLATAFTAVVVLRSGSAPSAGQPAGPVAANDHADGPTTAPPATESTGSPTAATSTAAQLAMLPLNPTVIVLDASGSMKEADAPGPRIEAAKRAVSTLVDALPDGSPIGLLVFGTSTDGSNEAQEAGCQDIRTLVPVGPLDRVALGTAVSGVVASGYTPLGAALRAAVAELPSDGPRTVILVSDGIDKCAPPEPCAVAAELTGSGLAIHTVGFRVDQAARQQLNCISDATGGGYVDADNAGQLAARLRSAVDPNTAVNTLTRTGFGGLELGMSVAQAQQVDSSITAAETGTVRIVWRDCELVFTDGKLTGITSSASVRTQDGLAVGDDVSRAVELYGRGVAQAGNGSARLVVPTGDGGDAGYDITFVPDAADPTAVHGRITTIVLCLCRPTENVAAFAAANADDYTKMPGRWWFRSPDGTWSCSIGTSVSITGQVDRSGTLCENRSGAEPPVSAQDRYVDCDLEKRGGWVVALSGAASYGSCMKGDASEFVYDVDKGVPGPGKVLPDHQVLVTGGWRCFIDGDAVTCANLTTGVGFTVSGSGYAIHPRDGAAPDPGVGAGTQSGEDVLRPDGYGSLKIGMTFDQAQAADASLVRVLGGNAAGCKYATSNGAESVLFNPDGGLSLIAPRGTPTTPEGLRAGDTVERAYQLYAPDQPRLLPENPSAVSFPVTPGSPIEYWIFFKRPGDDDTDATHATIRFIQLNRDQQCVG
jgi:Mg-chelatase subunit ChlD